MVVGNLVYAVGELRYQKLAGSEQGASSAAAAAADYWVLGSAVGGGALLTCIVVIVAVYKRKSTRAQRQFKHLQLQLDALESNIRNECKQGARAPL